MSTIVCFCGHHAERHGLGLGGPHTGACQQPLCGCLWYRPDLRTPPAAEEAA